MIVLDTNVVSELMTGAPTAVVESWLRRQPVARLRTTCITLAEAGIGIARLPDGRRKDGMAAAAGRVWALFGDRALPFDNAAAEELSDIFVGRLRTGRPLGLADAQIAAICRARRATLATRNTKDFEGLGLDVVDPWTAA